MPPLVVVGSDGGDGASSSRASRTRSGAPGSLPGRRTRPRRLRGSR